MLGTRPSREQQIESRSGALAIACQLAGTVRFSVKVAFKLGWSKTGKTVRARSGTSSVYR